MFLTDVLPGEGTDCDGKTVPESAAAEQEQSKDGGADMAARQDCDSNNKLVAKPGVDKACTQINQLCLWCTQSAGSSSFECVTSFTSHLTQGRSGYWLPSVGGGREGGSFFPSRNDPCLPLFHNCSWVSHPASHAHAESAFVASESCPHARDGHS